MDQWVLSMSMFLLDLKIAKKKGMIGKGTTNKIMNDQEKKMGKYWSSSTNCKSFECHLLVLKCDMTEVSITAYFKNDTSDNKYNKDGKMERVKK